ncbi:MAG: peptidase M3 [Burkholderiales bacterium]|nr:peptidase M3 [Burkholderiales bacterium]
METAAAFFHQINQEYLALHKAKEDLYWATYMGTSDDHSGFTHAEQALKAFISCPTRLANTRQHRASVQALPATPERDALLHGLTGWIALFEANIIETPEARALMDQLIAKESELFAANQKTQFFHLNEKGESELASLSSLITNMAFNPVEQYRKSSFEVLQKIEEWVLQNGFLDIVKLRNRFAQAVGYSNYFEYKVHKNEKMTVAELFAILDDFELRTRGSNQRALAEMRDKHGSSATAPWNVRFHQSGNVAREIEPYLPFAKSVQRWITSFRQLGIQFRGARMQLDLLERQGKYPNGFCHMPIPAFYDQDGKWIASEINFTSLAKPDQTGSGLRGLTTLFHEGGHAAQFANVTQNAPCFSQEFAPTSMAYAETQSMFCDSLLEDADWLKRYAKNAQGEAMPDELIRAKIMQAQPHQAFHQRTTALVAYFESALYKLDDDKLTAEAVLRLARATETSVLGISACPRPVLAIPHLLNQESAASYHGYLLAKMAVEQTRHFFLKRDGYLTDNPHIGPDLCQHYWQPGNSISHDEGLRSLTGEGFNAQYLADRCNLSSEEAWRDAQATIASSAARSYPAAPFADLDAHISLVHGAEVIADNSESDSLMSQRFEEWVAQKYQIAA